MTEDQAKQAEVEETPDESVEPSEDTKRAPETTVDTETDWQGLANSRYEQLIRLQADFENFRRRVDRERSEAEVQTIGRMLHALLPVYDNLERALRFMPDEGDAKAWRVGVEMTFKGFNEALDGLGVQSIATVGEVFDPRVHEAVQEVSSDLAEGLVAEELQRGFRWRDRVLRAALVKVSTGPDHSEQQDADSASEHTTDFEA